MEVSYVQPEGKQEGSFVGPVLTWISSGCAPKLASLFPSFHGLENGFLLLLLLCPAKGLQLPFLPCTVKDSPGIAELSGHMAPIDLSALPSFFPFMALTDYSYPL